MQRFLSVIAAYSSPTCTLAPPVARRLCYSISSNTAESENLFLVGDIIDGWRLKRRWFWPQGHNDVLQKLLRKARKGTKVVFIPGNHDEFIRDYDGLVFGDIEVRNCTEHTTARKA
jgi:UDP-2,3-diacylglucosamine pyrophosphatase LpxH